MPRKLSKRATAMLHRLYEGAFYPCDISGPIPKAMQELIDAGLVQSGGRVVKIARYYVPRGHKPFVLDAMPRKPKWLK